MKLARLVGTKVGVCTLLLGGVVAIAAPALVKLEIKNTGSPVPNLVIEVPPGTTFEEKFTNTLITNGKGFQVMVTHGKEDLASLKKAHAGPDSLIKEVKTYDVDAPDTLMYEGVMFGRKGYHFVHNVKIGKAFYKCQDWRKPDGVYSKADAEAMLASCKTLKKK